MFYKKNKFWVTNKALAKHYNMNNTNQVFILVQLNIIFLQL